MKDLGFKKVYNLLGGFGAWKSEGLKVVVTKGEILKSKKQCQLLNFLIL